MTFGDLLFALQLGLLYSLLPIAIVLSFKYLSFPDLTIEGSFTSGAAVYAALIVHGGIAPVLAIVGATIFSALAGGLTGLLSTRLKIAPLLSGILVMTMLYSINIRILQGANISLLGVHAFFEDFGLSYRHRSLQFLILFAIISILAVTALSLLLRTEAGMALRAVGDNPHFVTAMGWDKRWFVVVGLTLANGLVGLCGALVAQRQGFADVSMGVGILVVGLASLIIGDGFFPAPRSKLTIPFIAAIAGSCGYQLAVSLGLRIGLAPSDLRLATASIVILALGLGSVRRWMPGVGNDRD